MGHPGRVGYQEGNEHDPNRVRRGGRRRRGRSGGKPRPVITEETIGKQLELLKEAVPRIARVGVVVNPGNPVYGPVLILTLASANRLPTMYGMREFVDGGGLMSYGPSLVEMYRRAAYLVDKILRGGKPSNLPVEQTTRFELVINLTTAKALGLTLPHLLLVRADEVIQ